MKPIGSVRMHLARGHRDESRAREKARIEAEADPGEFDGIEEIIASDLADAEDFDAAFPELIRADTGNVVNHPRVRR